MGGPNKVVKGCIWFDSVSFAEGSCCLNHKVLCLDAMKRDSCRHLFISIYGQISSLTFFFFF